MKKTLMISFALSNLNAASPLTYQSLCEAAYKLNATLLSTKASVEAQETSIGQAQAGFLPTFNATVSGTPSQSKSKGTASGTANGAASTHTRDFNKQLQVSQSLFSGGSTIAGIKQAKYNVAGAYAQLAGQEAQLFEQVLTAYLTLCSQNQTVQLMQQASSMLNAQLAAAKKAPAVDAKQDPKDAMPLPGGAAQGGAAQLPGATGVQSQGAATQLQDLEQAAQAMQQTLAQQQTALTAAQQAFTQLTGIAAPKNPQYLPLIMQVPATLQAATSLSNANSQSITGALATLHATAAQKTISTASMLPSVTLSASVGQDYNTSRTPLVNPKTHTRTLNKQVVVNLNVPFYTPGSWSQRQQQVRTMVANKYSILAAQQQAQQGVASAFTGYTTAQAQLTQANSALIKATPANLAKANINELQAYLQAKGNVIGAEMGVQKAAYQLLGACGLISASSLGINFRACDYYDQFANSQAEVAAKTVVQELNQSS